MTVAPRPLRPHVTGDGDVRYFRHDGTIPVNGGTAPVFNDAGTRRYQHAFRRCQHCKARYSYLGFAIHHGRFTCPACSRARALASLHRNRRRGVKSRPPCRQCGAPIPLDAHLHRRYCNDDCRRAALPAIRAVNQKRYLATEKGRAARRRATHAARRRRRAETASRRAGQTCQKCGAGIPSERRLDARYCSPACHRAVHAERMRRWRARKKEAVLP